MRLERLFLAVLTVLSSYYLGLYSIRQISNNLYQAFSSGIELNPLLAVYGFLVLVTASIHYSGLFENRS